MRGDLIVQKVDRARLLLVEARDAGQAKQAADLAESMERYAHLQGASEEVIRYVTNLKVDALTLMGEYLEAAPKNKGGGPGRGKRGKTCSKKEQVLSAPTLAEQGIEDRKLSADAQALAALKRKFPPIHEQARNGEITVRDAAAYWRRQQPKKPPKGAKPARALRATPDDWTVDQADCLPWFAAQPADSLDLVFGSPPYEKARLYLENDQDLGIIRNAEAWATWMVQVYEAALRCCTGLVAFVVEGQTKDYRWSGAPALLLADLCRKGIVLRKPPIFQRVGIPGSGGPDWLRNDYEFIVCATRGGRLPWSDNTALGEAPKYEAGGIPSHRQVNGQRVNDPVAYATMQERANEGSHRARRRRGRIYHPPERANPGNIIDCGAVGGGNMGSALCHENEAPFPERLAEFFVRTFCPPGGVVCDPFSGSGTTAAAAKQWGRAFRGCDLRASQVRLTRRRIKAAQPPLPLEL